MTSTIICFFTLKFWIGTSRKGDEDRDWKHSTSSCRQKPLSRLIFKRRTYAALIELDVNQRWLTGQGHFRGQSDFNWGRCPSGPTPRSAPGTGPSHDSWLTRLSYLRPALSELSSGQHCVDSGAGEDKMSPIKRLKSFVVRCNNEYWQSSLTPDIWAAEDAED